jgi:hypothetical protein
MLLPCALLDPLLFLSALRSFVASLLLSTRLPIVLVPPLLLLSVLLPIVLVLPLLSLSMLLLLVLVLPLLLLSVLLPIVLVLPLLLLSMLLLLLLGLPLLLGMLPFGLSLLVLALLLLGMVLLFALLLVLCVSRSSDSEKQRQNGCTGDSNYFHRCYLHLLPGTYACSSASFLLSR